MVDYQSHFRTYPNALVNSHITDVLKIQDNDELLIDMLKAVNISQLNTSQFIDTGLMPFVKSCKAIGDDELQELCKFLQLVKSHDDVTGNGSSFLYPIISLHLSKDRTYPILEQLLLSLGRYKLIDIAGPLTPQSAGVVFSNLCYVYEACEESYIQRNIMECLSFMSPESMSAFNEVYFGAIQKLFQSSLTQRLIDSVSQQETPVSVLGTYLAMSSLDQIGEKNNTLVLLLMNKPFVEMVFSRILGFSSIEEITGGNVDFFEICIQLLNFYLTLATDAEIFADNSTVPIPTITSFSEMLKQFVFQELWSTPLELRSRLLDPAIDLITRVYTRDSRLHFCSDAGHETFWESRDERFLKCAIYKMIDEYDGSYRAAYDAAGADPLTATRIAAQQHLKTEILAEKRGEWSRTNGQGQLRKLEVLVRVPFFIPFDQRVEIFYTLIALDKDRLGINGESSVAPSLFMGMNGGGVRSTTISREHILEDAMGAYDSIGERFKSKLSVNFVNEFGPEEGIDGGGVTKEFLTSVSDEGFKDAKYGLFRETAQHELYPRPTRDRAALARLEFMGKIVGKCLYEHVLIDVALADFFLKKLLGASRLFRSTFDDLQSLDSALYASLNKLLGMPGEQIAALELTFEATDVLDPAGLRTVELIPGGRNIHVTRHNVLQYVLKLAEYKLDRSLTEAVAHFHRGLSGIIAPLWLEMFSARELEMLISGGTRDVDVADLRKNTEYGGYTDADATIVYLWEILGEMSAEERCKFVKFVTSVPQAPLRGFGSLEPRFGVRNAGREDPTRLPTASTCVNLLKLPDYGDKALLREKLLYSINSGARFDLS